MLMRQLAAAVGRPLPLLPKAEWLARCVAACAHNEAQPLYPLIPMLTREPKGRWPRVCLRIHLHRLRVGVSYTRRHRVVESPRSDEWVG